MLGFPQQACCWPTRLPRMQFAVAMGNESAEQANESWRDRLVVWLDGGSTRWLVVGLLVGVLAAVALAARSAPTPAVVSAIESSGRPVTLSQPADSPSSAISQSESTEILIDVVGKVRSPGLKRLPAGARVADAIAAAGGARGVPEVNLARRLADGEQLVVGEPDPVSLGPAPGNDAGTKSKISINSATATQLEELPRIGPVTAAKIIEFRNKSGGFRSVEQLRDVAGIGEVTFAGLVDLVQL